MNVKDPLWGALTLEGCTNMVEIPLINLWANFLGGHKLTPKRLGAKNGLVLVELCQKLAHKGSPRWRPYAARLASRKLVCEVAMEAGIDLAGFKYHGKVAMARGLLDAWNQVYLERYGGTYGTAGAKEVIRRNVKTKLGKQRVGHSIPYSKEEKLPNLYELDCNAAIASGREPPDPPIFKKAKQ